MASEDVMTVCDNVCRDFSIWFPSLLSIAGDIAAVAAAGVAVFAAFEWNKWKKQTVSQKGHEIALDALLALRAYEYRLNASRMRPTNTSDFTDGDFKEAIRLATSAKTTREKLVEKCYLIEELGLNDEVGRVAFSLIHLEGKISRKLSDARSAYDTGREAQKWEKLVAFFWSSPAETELDQEIESRIDNLRVILRGLARIEG
ncbi:hypothetical protein [Phaeobacter inhibens]|uniref:Uncharacterized protein n=1 Tax=Phaeobacter inhibens TaxID=221822 RepID=A0A2I7K9N9_9RHOB|nr:hypothetical protein [Phaeobacter inhibens]AUQ99316.1 hypothetical protein PhaeoP88_01946 [Phaeobacter inhibens]